MHGILQGSALIRTTPVFVFAALLCMHSLFLIMPYIILLQLSHSVQLPCTVFVWHAIVCISEAGGSSYRLPYAQLLATCMQNT